MLAVRVSAGSGVAVTAAAAPIVKWAGGKGRLVKTLLATLPANWHGRYLEPFCGGAALYFALPQARQESAILGDLNIELIECYAALVHDVEMVIRVATVHAQAHSREHYLEVRRMFNDETGELSIHERAAAFLYLSKAGYNGLWRVNASGGFNVPPGSYETIRFDDDNLRAAAKALGRARLIAGDYRATVRQARAGDLVFCDCPYDGAFDSYTANGFSHDDQRDLAADVAALARRGVHVMLTNAATDHVRELYRDLHVAEILGPRSISCNGDRKPAKELLITTYRPAASADTEARHGRWYTDTLGLPGISS
jgi:DNA adenine methylase